MERFRFLNLYIQFAQLLAGIVAIYSVVQAFRAWDAGFFVFITVLAMGLFSAFMLLVGADILSCFKSIEANTRKSDA